VIAAELPDAREVSPELVLVDPELAALVRASDAAYGPLVVYPQRASRARAQPLADRGGRRKRQAPVLVLRLAVGFAVAASVLFAADAGGQELAEAPSLVTAQVPRAPVVVASREGPRGPARLAIAPTARSAPVHRPATQAAHPRRGGRAERPAVRHSIAIRDRTKRARAPRRVAERAAVSAGAAKAAAPTAAARAVVEQQVLAQLATGRVQLPRGLLDPTTGLVRNNTTVACRVAGRARFACVLTAGGHGSVRILAGTDSAGTVRTLRRRP